MPAADRATLTAVYQHWFPQVLRWVAALGSPRADVEDLTQDTFVIVGRRLATFDGQNLPAWLREAIILFEIAGHSGEEVASLCNVPVNTVWTRLHHARKEFHALLSAEAEA